MSEESALIQKARMYRAIIEDVMKSADKELVVRAPSLLPQWKVGEVLYVGDRRYYSKTNLAYEVRQDHTTQADWTPDITPNLYIPISIDSDGTLDNPITAVAGMKYYYNKYYIEDGIIYKCTREDAVDGVVLQYLPSQLVGLYFEKVEAF